MVVGVLRRVAIPLVVIGLLMALTPAAVGLATAVYVAPKHTFNIGPGANHDIYTWQGIKLQSPDSSSNVADAATPATCQPTGAASCEDITVTVPQGSGPRTLYVKIAWTHPVWKAYLYVTSPGGAKTYGGALGCDANSFNKGCGNETALALDEVTIPAPAAGDWKIRVAAVNIHDETYQGLASLVNADPFQYSKEKLKALTQHLTKDQRVNLAFVGWTPDQTVMDDIRNNLPNEYIPSTAAKQSADGNGINDVAGSGSGLVQHQQQHYSGTDPNNADCCLAAFSGRYVPYFQPLKFNFQYHFLAANDTYTKDLFAAMKAATVKDQDFATDGVYATNLQNVPSHTRKYLEKYNANYGQFRGAHPAQCDAVDCKVDMIDAFKVEDWMQSTRLDPKYCTAFTDLRTGQKTGAQFINPDPTAVRDPYWDGNGTRGVNVDVQPQGTNQDITFFFIDTFFPSFADQYFNLGRYHTLASFSHIVDPDNAGAIDQVDNARGWGGRYRFYFTDMGAAPSFYEREQWLREEVNLGPGSAAFDPPVWQYKNDPSWNGTAPPPPDQNTRPAGSAMGAVLGWDVNQGFAFKYIGSYLYRPVPYDYYVLATNNWIDHYSLPSQGGFYNVTNKFANAYNPAAGLKALNSASPYVSFTDQVPGQNFGTPKELGCATNHHQVTVATVSPLTVVYTPALDPNCTDATKDPRQQAIEQGKNDGAVGASPPVTNTTVADLGVNANDLRNFIDHNRPTYAPLFNGVFTVPVLNIYFEKVYNVAIPLIVGGLAEGTNDGDGWGQIDNLNERSVTKKAIDCPNSLGGGAAAPACLPGGGPFTNARGLTYIVQHEAAHFQGLHHPHDGTASVAKASTLDGPPDSPFTGQWHWYYAMNKWQYDYTASPTTYGHTYGTYEVVDQDRLNYGHTSEYLKQAQDWVADGYFTEAANGATAPSTALSQRETTMKSERDYATTLFKAGDYLHSQYAMRNAMLHAKGLFFPPVAPHRLSLTESEKAAAAPLCTGVSIGCSQPADIVNGNYIFNINPQPVYSSDVCGAGIVISQPVPPVAPAADTLPPTATINPVGWATSTPMAWLALLTLPLAAVALLGRRRQRP